MLTPEQKDKIETLFFGKVLAQDEELEEFKAKFKYLGPLGQGAFAIVVAAKWLDKDEERTVAVKCFCKEDFERNSIEQFRKEAKMTQNIHHDHLLNNLAIIESSSRLYLVFPFMKGGTLAQYMLRRFSQGEGFTEKEVATILFQILSAVKCIQENKVVHRDLKPENILLERADDLTSLRVSDFGLAIRAGIDKVMSLYVKCGTPAYMAPEMFSDGLYTRSVDMWSVGVILYRLLTKGKYPFVPEELKQLAKNQQLNIEAKFRDIACSPNCMHLLRALLEPDVMKRSPYYVAVEHPFILQEDREPALRYFEVENAQEVTLRLRQAFRLLLTIRFINSIPECLVYRTSTLKSAAHLNGAPTPSKALTPKEFRIKEMNNKKSQSKFLSIPKSKAKVASSENCSKDKEDSDDTGGFGKYVSARASDRSERSIGLHEERGKDVQPLAFKPPRNRVASGTFRHEFTPPASLSQAKFQHPPKSSKSKDNLRSSVTCGRNFTNTDLPPISKKEASKVTKYPSVRVFPTAN